MRFSLRNIIVVLLLFIGFLTFTGAFFIVNETSPSFSIFFLVNFNLCIDLIRSLILPTTSFLLNFIPPADCVFFLLFNLYNIFIKKSIAAAVNILAPIGDI